MLRTLRNICLAIQHSSQIKKDLHQRRSLFRRLVDETDVAESGIDARNFERVLEGYW